jgi:hypothetical protein
MKIPARLPALALAYLAISFIASAQIAPSGIFRDQPTPTPQPSPTQTPVVAVTARTEPPPPVKSKEQPAKAKTKPTADAAPTSPAVEDDERPTGAGAGTLSKLRQMEREWNASPHNTATIEKMVADDFIGVTSEGKIVTKKAMLKGASDEKAEGSSSVGHMDVRLHGAKVAVVVGTVKLRQKDDAGRKSTTTYRFTDTWMERAGNWQCIASQATELPGKSDRAAAGSSSSRRR